MSQRRSNRPPPQDDEDPSLEEHINECVRYIVCREGSKIPIKRADIMKHLTTVCQTSSSHVNKVIVGANRKLKQIYGYKLVQVESKSGVQYIAVLTQECKSLPATVTDKLQRKILIAALTHIFMSGSAVKEDEMYKFLSEAGILEETDHAGRKILTHTLTKQLYLTYSKVGEGDLVRNVFDWGQRAIEEIPKMFLLDKMAQAFDKDVTHWCEQHKDAATESIEIS